MAECLNTLQCLRHLLFICQASIYWNHLKWNDIHSLISRQMYAEVAVASAKFKIFVMVLGFCVVGFIVVFFFPGWWCLSGLLCSNMSLTEHLLSPSIFFKLQDFKGSLNKHAGFKGNQINLNAFRVLNRKLVLCYKCCFLWDCLFYINNMFFLVSLSYALTLICFSFQFDSFHNHPLSFFCQYVTFITKKLKSKHGLSLKPANILAI